MLSSNIVHRPPPSPPLPPPSPPAPPIATVQVNSVAKTYSSTEPGTITLACPSLTQTISAVPQADWGCGFFQNDPRDPLDVSYLVAMRCLGKQNCTMDVGQQSLGLWRTCLEASQGLALQRTFNVTVNCTEGSALLLPQLGPIVGPACCC